MGGIASTAGRVVSGALTLGGSEIARAKLGPENFLSKATQLPGTIATGGLSALSGAFDTHMASTKLLSQEDPKLQLARTGGAQLLAQIAMGVPVEDALAGYFGKNSGADFKAYYNSLNDEEKSAIDSVRTQLLQVQTNTELRNKAVQKVVDDFPNVVSQVAPAVVSAKQRAGEEFDQASQQYIQLAMDKLNAKQAAGGMLSSGASAAASARAGAEMGLQRLQYTTDQGNQQLGLNAQNWQNRYNETSALRNFQMNMLGTNQQQGFSAAQMALQRAQDVGMFNANAQNQQAIAQQQGESQMFGALGGLAGTLGAAYIGGPMAASAFGAAMGKQSGNMQGGGSSGSIPFNYPMNNPLSRLNVPGYPRRSY